jgi:hypothetical protein
VESEKRTDRPKLAEAIQACRAYGAMVHAALLLLMLTMPK